jgi:hypothetical protein
MRGLGIDRGFHCGEVWSTEVLFQLSNATVLLLSVFLGPIAGHPTWGWVVGGLCARNRTKRFMF